MFLISRKILKQFFTNYRVVISFLKTAICQNIHLKRPNRKLSRILLNKEYSDLSSD